MRRTRSRDAKIWRYETRSDFAGLDGRSGAFTAVPPSAERTRRALSRGASRRRRVPAFPTVQPGAWRATTFSAW